MEQLISVIVATYKRIEGLIPTLESIRLQEYANKELIITDDGSGNEIISIINKYIEDNKKYFVSVTFIKNETNRGTVKNIQSAYSVAKGEIIKVLSPGDLFYDKMVLKNVNRYFMENSPLIACGIPRTYHKHEDKIIDDFLCNYSTYTNLNDPKMTMFNILFGSRYLIGATLIFHKDLFVKNDLYLPETIVYAEDLIQLYAVLKGIRIHLMNGYFIWYEYGTGISTNNNTVWLDKLYQDHIAFYSWLIDEKKAEKKALQDVSVKLESLKNRSRFSTIIKCLKNKSFLEFKIREKFFNEKLSDKPILEKHKLLIEEQKDGFIELITEGKGQKCLDY